MRPDRLSSQSPPSACSEPQRPSMAAALRPSSSLDMVADRTPSRQRQGSGDSCGAVVDIMSPLRTKCLSPGWYDPISPGSQTGVTDMTGNMLSPSSSIGSGMRVPSLAAVLPPAQVSANHARPFQWTPPHPHLRPPPAPRAHGLGAEERTHDGDVSPHTPRDQRIRTHQELTLSTPPTVASAQAAAMLEVGACMVSPVLSPPLRPPPAWSPPQRHCPPGVQPAPAPALATPPTVGFGAPRVPREEERGQPLAQPSSAAAAARVPVPSPSLGSPQHAWSPPRYFRGHSSAGATDRHVTRPAPAPILCTPVHDAAAEQRGPNTPSPEAVIPPAHVENKTRAAAAVRTPRHRAQTITFVEATSPSDARATQYQPPRHVGVRADRVDTETEPADEEDEDAYAVAIDDDGSILSNKDLRQRQRQQQEQSAFYLHSSPLTPPYASVAESSPVPVALPQMLTASPFVPFRSPVTVARPLFKFGDGEEESFADVNAPSFFEHMTVLTDSPQREGTGSVDGCAVASSPWSPRRQGASSDVDPRAACADLAKSAQWVNLLLLFRDRENEKPMNRVTPSLTTAARSQRPSVADREDQHASSDVSALLVKPASQSQAEEIQWATFNHVLKRCAEREKRVADALSATSFSHPLLHLR